MVRAAGEMTSVGKATTKAETVLVAGQELFEMITEYTPDALVVAELISGF